MTQKPIDVNELIKSLKKPTTGGGRRKKKEIDTTIRTLTLFFKMDRERGIDCENPNCADPRRGTDKAKNISIVTIRETRMCRECFLAGFGSENANP